jgi:hypothetical protein
MLKEEAEWFATRLFAADPDRCFPLLNMGSSDADLLRRTQPWVEDLIFARARAQGRAILNVDLKAAPGVDLVGDITDKAFQAALRKGGCRSVMCTNVLEHIPEDRRPALISALGDLVAPGAFLFLSVPKDYPLHYDPIDTLYRPSPQELAALFPAFRVVQAEEVRSGTYYDSLGRNPLRLGIRMARLLLPMINPRGHEVVRAHMRWINRRFSASCLVLEKRP